MLIDDFSKGPHTVTLTASGMDTSHQKTGNPNFPVRRTILQVQHGGRRQTATLDIDKGYLMLGTGALQTHALWLYYGVDTEDKPHPLGLNLSKFKGIRMYFDFSNLNLNVTVQGVSSGGAAQLPQNIGQGFGPFTIDYPFAGFVTLPGHGPLAMNKVDAIHFIVQSGSTHGGNDYVIRKLELF